MRPDRFGVFGYPVSGEERDRPLVAGWILVLLSFLVPVVPLIPFVGYLVRVIAAGAEGRPAPRIATDVAGLLKQGVGGAAVLIGYLTVPVLALVVTVYGATTRVTGPDSGPFETVLVYGGSTVVLSLFLLGLFLVPVGFAVYEREGLRAAFSYGRLKPVAGHAAYFSRWMAGTVALVTAGALANVALQIHRAGPVVASLILAYGAILAAHVWGLGIRRTRER